MTIDINFPLVNIVSVSSPANGGLVFFTLVDISSKELSDTRIYPFCIEGYVGVINIKDNIVWSFTVFKEEAAKRLAKLDKNLLKENLNKNKDILEIDTVLFNVTTGDLIGSTVSKKVFSSNWRINPPIYRDDKYDDYLILHNGRFFRTTTQFGIQLVLKLRLGEEIFESGAISEFLLGLFLELEEISLPEYLKLDEVLPILKPGKLNFDSYEKEFSADITNLFGK